MLLEEEDDAVHDLGEGLLEELGGGQEVVLEDDGQAVDGLADFVGLVEQFQVCEPGFEEFVEFFGFFFEDGEGEFGVVDEAH